MQIEERIARLIAVGASVAANCQSCLDANVTKALEAGSNRELIANAVAIGKLVRHGAASSMDSFILDLNASGVAGLADAIPCDCGLPRRTP